MPEIISNSSCIIILENIDMLWLLKKIYGEIIITEEVFKEFGKDIEKWIKIKKIKNRNYFMILRNFVDPGEASSIALGLETRNSKLILDDGRARKVAKNLGLNFTGTLGVIMKAKENSLISSVTEVIEKLKSYNFRLSDQLIERAKMLSGE